MNRKLDTEVVLQFVAESPRTVTDVAEKFVVNKLTASRFLSALREEGKLTLSGTQKKPGRGRPSFVYQVSGPKSE